MMITEKNNAKLTPLVAALVADNKVTLNQNFQSGDFGITLSDAPTDPATPIIHAGPGNAANDFEWRMKA